MNSNLVLENGQFLMQKQPGTSKMVMYVGDGISTLANLSPAGLLPDVLSRMIFIYNKEEGVQIPIVIADENGNVVFPGVPISGGASSGHSTGEIITVYSDTAPQNALICDGSTVDRQDYPDLYTFLQTNDPSLIVDNDYFTVPDLRGEFLRGKDTLRVLGSKEQDALQNITGSLGWVRSTGAAAGAPIITPGPIRWSNRGGQTPVANGSGSNGATDLLFDASWVVRTATETRPRNMAVNFAICY